MQAHEDETNSFIVKIWLEETGMETGKVGWRGHITHVSSGERHYVKDLDEISAFIRQYLQRFGLEMSIWMRIRQRLDAAVKRLSIRRR